MPLIRLVLSLLLVAALAGCATLGYGGNSAGVKIVGRRTYCGTPSQTSDVHHFSTKQAFENWVDYRDIGRWHERVPAKGLVIVEMGERPTGGYNLKLDSKLTKISKNTLTIGLDWHAPRLDAAVSQALITPCVAIALPRGNYQKVRVVDQLGNVRGQFSVK